MVRYVIQRILSIGPMLFLVSLAAFGLLFMTPGDPAVSVAGENATPERILYVRHQLGLDRSILSQFFSWLGRVMHGDFGHSLVLDARVTDLLTARIWPTVSLMLGALVVSALLGIPAGIIAGTRPGSAIDRIVTFLATFWIALPSFWLAIFLIDALAIKRDIFPAVGYVPFSKSPGEWLHHIALPSLTIGVASAAEVARQTRSTVVRIFHLDYIRTSTSLGIPRRRVLRNHVLKNAAIPIVTVLGMQVGRAMSSAVVLEQIFAIPGLGQLTVSSVRSQDLPTVQGVVIVLAVFVLSVNLLVDLSYAAFDPRLRKS